MELSNTTTLSPAQEDKLGTLARKLFIAKHGDTFFHFSFEGTQLNFETMNAQAVFEIADDNGSFHLFIDLGSANVGLKKSLKIVNI